MVKKILLEAPDLQEGTKMLPMIKLTSNVPNAVAIPNNENPEDCCLLFKIFKIITCQ